MTKDTKEMTRSTSPQLLAQVRHSIDSYIEHIQPTTASTQETVIDLLLEIEQTYANSIDHFIDEDELKAYLERFLSEETSEEQSINAMKKLIETIRKYIIDIEMVSINAMIHSRRLGGNGKAFGVISQNIKEFSNEMKNQYNSAYEHVNQLNKWNETFIEKINGLMNYSNELRSMRLSFFKQLIQEAVQTKNGQPSTDNQAIITEQMSELKNAMDLLESESDADARVQTLNTIAQLLQEAEQKQPLSVPQSAFDEKINKLQVEISQFVDELAIFEQEIAAFREEQAVFEEEMSGVETQFSAIKGKMDYLKRLNVMSRIEISRLDREMQNFGDEIDQISGQVVREVEASDTFINSLKEKLINDLQSFFTQLDYNHEHLRNMKEVSERFLHQLQEKNKSEEDKSSALNEAKDQALQEVENMILHLNTEETVT